MQKFNHENVQRLGVLCTATLKKKVHHETNSKTNVILFKNLDVFKSFKEVF
jgi:hypothetical protein